MIKDFIFAIFTVVISISLIMDINHLHSIGAMHDAVAGITSMTILAAVAFALFNLIAGGEIE